MTCSSGSTTLLQHRCLATLMNLAARKGAKPGLAERVLAYLEAGDKADPEDTAGRPCNISCSSPWIGPRTWPNGSGRGSRPATPTTAGG